MADRLFFDVRQFAAPPGRPSGAERFERRPTRLAVGPLVRGWIARWRGTDGDPDPYAVASYLPGDWR